MDKFEYIMERDKRIRASVKEFREYRAIIDRLPYDENELTAMATMMIWHHFPHEWVEEITKYAENRTFSEFMQTSRGDVRDLSDSGRNGLGIFNSSHYLTFIEIFLGYCQEYDSIQKD